MSTVHRKEDFGLLDKPNHELDKLRPNTGQSHKISFGTNALSLFAHVFTAFCHIVHIFLQNCLHLGWLANGTFFEFGQKSVSLLDFIRNP